jgi:hypothetical protein
MGAGEMSTPKLDRDSPPARMTRRQLAEYIAASLFVNGAGQYADRLILAVDGPPSRDLGGWCLKAVADRIELALRGVEIEPESALRAEVQRLRVEANRLAGWLKLIDGGDNPCTDESQLRQWAYDAITLGKEAPE